MLLWCYLYCSWLVRNSHARLSASSAVGVRTSLAARFASQMAAVKRPDVWLFVLTLRPPSPPARSLPSHFRHISAALPAPSPFKVHSSACILKSEAGAREGSLLSMCATTAHIPASFLPSFIVNSSWDEVYRVAAPAEVSSAAAAAAVSPVATAGRKVTVVSACIHLCSRVYVVVRKSVRERERGMELSHSEPADVFALLVPTTAKERSGRRRPERR